MSKVNDFLDFINKKTCNRYEFLRLRQVFFDKKNNTCSINLMYPSSMELDKSSKEEISKVVKQYVSIDGLVEVNISKSFIEKDLILSFIKKFLQVNSPFVFSTMDFDKFEISINGDVSIKINLLPSLYDYFERNNLSHQLLIGLQKNFYAQFDISLAKIDEKEIAKENVLSSRFQEIEMKSDIDGLLSRTQDKYFVSDKKVVVGGEINFNPRFISSIKQEFENCVIAGQIGFITEKTFKSKRMKKNKDGTQEPIEKPYFRFQIKDNTGVLHGVIFPSVANYHKMHLITNGNIVLVQGRVSRYNDVFEISAKNISFCTIPEKNEILQNIDQNTINDYRYVRPQKYYSQKQTNIFDKNTYSKEVMNGTFVVYDFETTGINASQDDIIEIGALKIVNGEFTEVFSTLVKPKHAIPQEATKVNRITNEMVANCYSIEQVIRDFYLFCKGAQMVGYNSIAFDSLFLARAGKSVGITFDNEQLDAFLLARQKIRGLKNYKLGTVANYLKVSLIDAHRALNDVIATAGVFMLLY